MPISSASSSSAAGSTDGWVDASAQTWTQASATTFTVPTDLTTTFTTGTRLRLTQSSTVKYFVVVSSAFGATTTVTVTGGSDYTLAAAAITANSYSYAANPQGYPGWFNYAPAATGFGSKTNDTARFAVTGRVCFLAWAIQGTSNATTMTITLPIASAASIPSVGGITVIMPCRVTDNGTVATSPGRLDCGASTTTGTFTLTFGGTAFTNTGTKGTIGTAQYEI